MSPRRKIRPGEQSLLAAPPVQSPGSRKWLPRIRRPSRPPRLPLAFTVAALLMVAAVAGSALMLVSHLRSDSAAEKGRAVVSYVSSFMTDFASVDPFHANDYVDRILTHATGEFQKQFEGNANEILLQIARGERTTGTVLDAGIERWNDDGSANVLVATEVTSKSPDGKQLFDNTGRWLATAKQEGNAWKISNLSQVI
jgi:Mce-associated membrane protein